MQAAASNVETIVVSKQLDCSGDLCPMPVYKTSMSLNQLAVGDVLEVICTDPGSLKDFPALAQQTGHELIRVEEREGAQVFYIRKGSRR